MKRITQNGLDGGLIDLYNFRLMILMFYVIHVSIHARQNNRLKSKEWNQFHRKKERTLLKYSILVSVFRLHILDRLFGSLFVIYLLVLILALCFLLLVLLKILVALHLIYYPKSDSLLDNQ